MADLSFVFDAVGRICVVHSTTHAPHEAQERHVEALMTVAVVIILSSVLQSRLPLPGSPR